MKTRRTPQEKKQLSYAKDRRNAYGESDKASRKGIRFQKRRVNQTFRFAINRLLRAVQTTQQTAPDQADDLENRINGHRRRNWKKSPDMPLGTFIQWQRDKHNARVRRNKAEKGGID